MKTRVFAAVIFIAVVLAFSLHAADQTNQPIAKELSDAKTVYLMKSGADLRFVDLHLILTIAGRVADPQLWKDNERSGVTTAAAANLVKRLRDRVEKAK